MRKSLLIACMTLIPFPGVFLISRELDPKEKTTLSAESNPAKCICMSRDGKTLAMGNQDGTVKLWDVASAKEKITFKAHQEPVLSVAFSWDGKILATGTNGRLKENTVKLWDAGTGKERLMQDSSTGRQRQLISPHMPEVYCLAFSPDGSTLAVGGASLVIALFDLKRGQPLALLDGHEAVVRSLAFAADGRSLISWGEDGTVKVWDVPAQQ